MEYKFEKPFGSYACEGDTVTTYADGFKIEARIVRDDTISSPDEQDEGFWPSKNPKAAGYVIPHNFDEQMKKAEEAMAAWNRGDWFYCGVVLKVSKEIRIESRTQEEVVLSDHAASRWGIEVNFPGGNNSSVNEIANELLSEAIAFGKEVLSQIKR